MLSKFRSWWNKPVPAPPKPVPASPKSPSNPALFSFPDVPIEVPMDEVPREQEQKVDPKQQVMNQLLTVMRASLPLSDWPSIERAIDDVLVEYPSEWLLELKRRFPEWVQMMQAIEQKIQKNEPGQNPRDEFKDNLGAMLVDEGFILEKVYGAGVYGFVLRAIHVASERHVAVKVVKLKNQSSVHLFLIERVMHDLFAKAHLAPLILDGFELQTHGKRVGITVMQERPVNLQTFLFQVYQTGSHLDIGRWNTWVIAETNRIFDIMTQLHLIHADVKPDNMVVVFPTPHEPHLELLDFGLSYINHRTQEWPEWIWFCILVLHFTKDGDDDSIREGFKNLWWQMVANRDVRSSLEKAASRFDPEWNVVPWIQEHTRHANFDAILQKLVPIKNKLDVIMFRELGRFADCAFLPENANAIHQQRQQRLLHDTVPADTKTLQQTVQKAKQCVRQIRFRYANQYVDDPDYE